MVAMNNIYFLITKGVKINLYLYLYLIDIDWWYDGSVI